jgi:hypothetical protein
MKKEDLINFLDYIKYNHPSTFTKAIKEDVVDKYLKSINSDAKIKADEKSCHSPTIYIRDYCRLYHGNCDDCPKYINDNSDKKIMG